MTNPLDSACFMTGGTYNVTDSLMPHPSGGSASGCFQLGKRLDIRNCLCGRIIAGTLYTLGTDEQKRMKKPKPHDLNWDAMGAIETST